MIVIYDSRVVNDKRLFSIDTGLLSTDLVSTNRHRYQQIYQLQCDQTLKSKLVEYLIKVAKNYLQQYYLKMMLFEKVRKEYF